MGYDEIRKYPLLRLLTPLVGGVLIGESLSRTLLNWTSLSLFLFFIGLLLLTLVTIVALIYNNKGVTILLYILLFLLGCFRFISNSPPLIDDHFAKVYRGVVMESATLKPNSSFYTFTVRIQNTKGTILLQIPEADFKTGQVLYSVGDVIAFTGRVKQPHGRNVSSAFNYSDYLLKQGISGVCYIRLAKSELLGHELVGKWRSFTLAQRERVITRFEDLGFKGEALALVVALTTGVREQMSSELKMAYTEAGVSHVLALSGLHLGVIYLFLSVLFKTLLRILPRGDVLAIMLSSLSIWVFVLFTGASPSIVRSAFLFTLLGLATLTSRKREGINALATAAFFMLLVNPNWLFHISFQLSFSAVAAIYLFQRSFESLYKPKNRLVRYVWSLLVLSFIAQLGTTPWVLYHFGSFSPYFLLTNLFVIPLISLLLYSIMVMFILSFMPLLQALLAKGVLLIVSLIHLVIKLVVDLPNAYLTSLYIYPLELLTLVVGLVILAVVYKYFKHKFLVVSLVCLITFLSVRIYYSLIHWPSERVELHLVKGSPVLQITDNKSRLFVILPDTMISVNEVHKVFEKHWAYQQLKSPLFISRNDFSDSPYWSKGLFSHNKQSLLFVDSIPQLSTPTRFSVNRLVLLNGFRGRLEELFIYYNCTSIIVPRQFSTHKEEELRRLCLLNNVIFITLDEKAYLDLLR